MTNHNPSETKEVKFQTCATDSLTQISKSQISDTEEGKFQTCGPEGIIQIGDTEEYEIHHSDKVPSDTEG